jgi:hypothetical protein
MDRTEPRTAQTTLIGLIILLALGSIGYRVLVAHRLEQTAAMFIGLPAILAIGIALLPRAKSATGMIVKVLTLLLLLSGILLAEGFICIIMAAPLVLGVGCIIGLVIDYVRRKQRLQGTSMLVIIPIALMGAEGTIPQLSFPRENVVWVEKVVHATAADVQFMLGETPRFRTPYPFYFRLRFPLPAETSGGGLQQGALRVIHFAGGEGKPGDLVMRVAESDENHVRFVAVRDASKIAHWMRWEESRVDFRNVGPGITNVRWTISFRRDLDPAWYFGLWERYAVRLVAQYLIDNVATPPVPRG